MHLLEHRYNNGVRTQRSPLIGKLSDRELQVLDLIGSAKSSREIADTLIISIKTVESPRANIKQKLRLQTAQELTRAAVRWVEGQRIEIDSVEVASSAKLDYQPREDTVMSHGLPLSSFIRA